MSKDKKTIKDSQQPSPDAKGQEKSAQKQPKMAQQVSSEKKVDLKKSTQDASKEKPNPVSSSQKGVSGDQTSVAAKTETKKNSISLQALFAYKVGMTNVYDKKNQYIPVTVLQYKPCKVTQIKTKEQEGYSAVQVALESPKKRSKAQQIHLKKAGFKQGAHFIREVRQTLPEGIQVGQQVSIESLKQGDKVRLSGISKGHGFAGVVKRWGFAGGPASHGAEKHRTTGSIANTATQGRVFPGKKMPGHFGCDRTTIPNVKVIQVESSKGIILVKGPVPGAIRSLVELRKQGNP